MAILNIFKKKKEPSPVEAQKSEEKKEVLKESKVTKKGKDEKVRVVPKTDQKIIRKRKKLLQAYKILKVPHITEKATDLAKDNKYTFKVWPETNKIEIKKTIEDLYDVDVLSVRIINIPPKRRRLGKTLGWRKGYKKAIVKIKEGQKIEVLPR